MTRIHGWINRKSMFASVVGVVLVVVPVASASGAPTFDVSTMTPVLYAAGAALLAGVVLLLSPVILTKIPFALVRIALRAINKLTGNAKPAAG